MAEGEIYSKEEGVLVGEMSEVNGGRMISLDILDSGGEYVHPGK